SGKRFHATISFMADTGLKKAIETDVNVLDVSLTSTEILMHAENAYNKCVSRIENEIIPSLKK
ncbi:1036_t:CDS:2, partial [Entrophospora sp. SA101]